MADVFISYAREDKQRAEHVARGLSELGLECFWDSDIPPGQTWADYIESKLGACKAVVVLWSENSTKSNWVREEARMGREKAKLIPAALDKSPPPFGFGEVQAADLSMWDGDFAKAEWRRFAGAVETAVRGSPAAAPQPTQAWASPPPPPPQQHQSSWTAAAASAPVAAASPLDYIKKCLRLYANGAGRARRSELGWFLVFIFVLSFLASALDLATFGYNPYTGMAYEYVFTGIVMLALIAPTVSAASRRAHDFGQSGWLAALTVIPYIGFLIAAAFALIPGHPGANAHGPDPRQKGG
ncbi:MAG: TIR domain-containing protein [Hyphomonadaceae bacterium]